MTDDSSADDPTEPPVVDPEDPAIDPPTVTCSRCDREWTLDFELEELHAGNGALEQFAMDHHRHTGHFPDEVTPWRASCRRCPASESFLAERPTRRWARTHARHTAHGIELEPPEDEAEVVSPPGAEGSGDGPE